MRSTWFAPATTSSALTTHPRPTTLGTVRGQARAIGARYSARMKPLYLFAFVLSACGSAMQVGDGGDASFDASSADAADASSADASADATPLTGLLAVRCHPSTPGCDGDVDLSTSLPSPCAIEHDPSANAWMLSLAAHVIVTSPTSEFSPLEGTLSGSFYFAGMGQAMSGGAVSVTYNGSIASFGDSQCLVFLPHVDHDPFAPGAAPVSFDVEMQCNTGMRDTALASLLAPDRSNVHITATGCFVVR